MAENTSTTRRHTRQRSSVQIKKRVSLQKPGSSSNDLSSPNGGSGADAFSPAGEGEQGIQENAFQYDREEPKDNLLSSTASSPLLPNSHQANSIQAITNRTHSRGPSFNPQHGSYENPIESDEDKASKADYLSHNHPEMSGNFSEEDQGAASMGQSCELNMHTNGGLNEQNAMGDMTTRAELDLFDDDDNSEDQAALQPSSATSEKGPELPPKDETNVQKSDFSGESVEQFTTPVMGSQEAANGTFRSAQRANRNSNNFMTNSPAQSTPSSANKGAKRLSLLINNGLSNSPSSPNTSPLAIRTPTASTPRSGRKAHRMSLGYFPSPDARSSQSPTPYSAPAANGSNTPSSGSIAQPRFTRSTAPRSASVSTTASFDSSSLDGETILNQHKGVLERIAEKERAILELKETLAKEEKELLALRVEWQKSAARELASNGRSSTEIGDRSDRKDEIRLPSLDADAINSIPTSAASDTFKGLSAKLQSGIGTQFNAFLDQLVNVPTTESVSSTNEASSTDTRNTSLGSLLEEDEEEGGQPAKNRSGVPPPVPSKLSPTSKSVPPTQASKEMPKNHSKRSSIFGASFAAFQKQMEQQFAPALGGEEDAKNRQSKEGLGGATSKEDKENKDHSQAGPSANDFSWGNLSKRFKEARENASGYLAMAEAKLGQAMTIDDLLQLDDQKPNEKAKSNSSIGGPRGFAEENDREKAALAELSWLNSMAGIKMSGSVDRVTTSVTSPDLQSTNGNLNSQNLLRLEDARRVARAASPASSSQSTTRPDHSPNERGSNAGLHSPPLGVTKVRRTSASGVGPMKNPEKRMTGIFDVLSAVWLGEKSPGEESNSATSPGQRTMDLDKNKKRLSGQSRTRFAARAALDQGESGNVLSPKAKENAMETAWDWDAPLQPLPENGAINGMGIGLVGMHEESSKPQSQSRSQDNRSGKSRRSGEDMQDISLNDQPGQDLDHLQSTKSNQKKGEEEENWSW
ncbi:uncharacterized protein FA14DRAFT_24575 [Meira miltonrushii]|uniref:Uncharacterized protein n=1 Tax=Meira miltonrushii TaxID=1280837 RepID=A0A316VKV2_9BASI|nr:uncharacterized protein FA14DRAFT_24575 [Meira miltonrushii]PWN38259.1 hypothetical protein FA14DRAFT_24575 [Meira miltonrushii]